MTLVYEEYLAHHGIKGQRWGVRRFQNEDGTLTEEGKKRYNKELVKDVRKNWYKAHNDANKEFNPKLNEINEKYANVKTDLDAQIWDDDTLKYVQEVNAAWKNAYKKQADIRFGENPIWKDVDPADYLPLYNQYDLFISEHTKH